MLSQVSIDAASTAASTLIMESMMTSMMKQLQEAQAMNAKFQAHIDQISLANDKDSASNSAKGPGGTL